MKMKWIVMWKTGFHRLYDDEEEARRIARQHGLTAHRYYLVSEEEAENSAETIAREMADDSRKRDHELQDKILGLLRREMLGTAIKELMMLHGWPVKHAIRWIKEKFPEQWSALNKNPFGETKQNADADT